jgi:hypothetical protein
MELTVGTLHHLRFYQISAQSDFKYGHLVAILEKQLNAVNPSFLANTFSQLLRDFFVFHQVSRDRDS